MFDAYDLNTGEMACSNIHRCVVCLLFNGRVFLIIKHIRVEKAKVNVVFKSKATLTQYTSFSPLDFSLCSMRMT